MNEDYVFPEQRSKEENVDMNFSEAMRLILHGRRVRLPEWSGFISKYGLKDNPTIFLCFGGTSRSIEWQPQSPWIMRDDWMEA